MKQPYYLQKIILFLKKLPAVGTKSAERFAFNILQWSENDLHQFGQLLKTLPELIQKCPECGFFLEKEGCPICQDPKRNKKILCIVSSIKDIFALENSAAFSGLYHILPTLLSPADDKYLDPNHLDQLYKRIENHEIFEIILAFDATIEGDVTALFLKKQLIQKGLKVTRLASGVPIGSSLEYIDHNTLAKALMGRQTF